MRTNVLEVLGGVHSVVKPGRQHTRHDGPSVRRLDTGRDDSAPIGTMPDAPAAIWRFTRAFTPSWSTSSRLLNGVTMAVNKPVTAFLVSSIPKSLSLPPSWRFVSHWPPRRMRRRSRLFSLLLRAFWAVTPTSAVSRKSAQSSIFFLKIKVGTLVYKKNFDTKLVRLYGNGPVKAKMTRDNINGKNPSYRIVYGLFRPAGCGNRVGASKTSSRKRRYADVQFR